jgi:putative sterol carrier protein
MSSASEYFTEQVPEAWNARLREQEQSGDDGAELLEKMRAARFAVRIDVAGDDGGCFDLGVEAGEMAALDAPVTEPLLTLAFRPGDWHRLAESVGPAPFRLLGGIGGIEDFVITADRVTQLAQVAGTLLLQVTGDDPWSVVLHFGPPPVGEADATVSIAAEPYAELIAGGLDLQGAFMSGKLELEGNVEIPMKLALAVMTPE